MGRRRWLRWLAVAALLCGVAACFPARPALPAPPEPGTPRGGGAWRRGIDQPTRPLAASEVIAVPWDRIETPFVELGIGEPKSRLVSPEVWPYRLGVSATCMAIETVANHPADQVEFTSGSFWRYGAATSFAIGTLPDGVQYRVAAGGPDTSHLSDSTKASLLQRYSGYVLIEVMGNCPFPQFLPEQGWISAGSFGYLDPTNRGAIVLVGPVHGHVLMYRYRQANGRVDPTIHFFDFETATFS